MEYQKNRFGFDSQMIWLSIEKVTLNQTPQFSKEIPRIADLYQISLKIFT